MPYSGYICLYKMYESMKRYLTENETNVLGIVNVTDVSYRLHIHDIDIQVTPRYNVYLLLAWRHAIVPCNDILHHSTPYLEASTIYRCLAT